MGAILSLIKTGNSIMTGLSLIIFIITFTIFLLLTYYATGMPFGVTIPPSTSISSSFVKVLCLMLAWAICLPMSVVSFVFYLLLHILGLLFNKIQV